MRETKRESTSTFVPALQVRILIPYPFSPPPTPTFYGLENTGVAEFAGGGGKKEKDGRKFRALQEVGGGGEKRRSGGRIGWEKLFL